MFWLFEPKCPVEADAKRWIEWRMAWLTNELGWERILDARVVLPTDEFFPTAYDGSPDAVQAMLDRICGFMGVDPSLIELRFYSENDAAFLGDRAGTAGLYDPLPDRVAIWIETSRLNDPLAVAGTIAHELGHVVLLGEGRVRGDVEDLEPLTDLATVFLGLGVLTANSVIRESNARMGRWSSWSISRLGYLTFGMYSYALAAFSWVRGEHKPKWSRHLRPDVREPFRAGLRYLEKTGDSTYRRDGPLGLDSAIPFPLGPGPSAEPEPQDGRLETDGPLADEDDTESLGGDDLFTNGVSLMAELDFEGAVAAFEQAIRQDPHDAECYQQRSLAHSALGSLSEALADAVQAVRLAPDEIESYRIRGQALLAVSDYADAINDFDRIIKEEKWDFEHDKRRWQAYYWRGCAFAAQGDLDRALSDFDKAVTFGPLQAEVYLERAEVYRRVGIPEKAERDRDRARQLGLE